MKYINPCKMSTPYDDFTTSYRVSHIMLTKDFSLVSGPMELFCRCMELKPLGHLINIRITSLHFNLQIMEIE